MPYSDILPTRPQQQGLYDPRFEHDACGVAFVATLTGVASHQIVKQGIQALLNLDHRGAAGAETNSGDGAGILIQVPDAFLREVVDFTLPPAGAYAVGTAFLPGDAEHVAKTKLLIEEIAGEEGLEVLGWREVPVDPSTLGDSAKSVMPAFSQLFVSGAGSRITVIAHELGLLVSLSAAGGAGGGYDTSQGAGGPGGSITALVTWKKVWPDAV